ncbi:MAG: beta-phosphoglucomutase [Aggregatilineales bacterium]
MTTIGAFIFDLDGVLTDTAEYHFKAWKRLADENELPFTREDNDQLRGVDRRESLRRLLKGKSVPAEQFEAWLTLKNDYYRAFLTELSPADLLPGVSHFLSDARARGIKLGVGSASKNAHDVIERLGIAPLFDALGDGYSVSNPKPAPDLFVWVAGRLNIPPAQSVVFEDSEAGIDAAVAGGMLTVGIGPRERVGRAQVVIPGFTNVTVEDVLKRL